VIFVLATVGMIVYYTDQFAVTFWLTIGLIVAYPCTFIIFVPLLTGGGKLSGKKILLVTFSITIISVAVSSSVWTIVTPKWSFSVTTDKPTYSLGENVQIVVSLDNLGFIPHSFKSSLSNPVLVTIETQSLSQVWYSSFHRNITEFTIFPHQSLERTFIWSQTNIHYTLEIEPDKYYIVAFIPHATSNDTFWNRIFYAETSITITSR